MKIKDVCRRTGLTEKAVRYYVENGLVSPEEYIQRGRTYRDYSEKDVRTLMSISTLRQIGMSVEKIKAVGGVSAQRVMQEHLKDLGSEVERKQKLLDSLSREDYTSVTSAEQLAELVSRATRAEPAQPNFSQFNDLDAFRDDLGAFEQRSIKRELRLKKGARLGSLVAAAMLFGSALALSSVFGIILFLLAALAAIGLGSDYIGFFRTICAVGAVSDIVGFMRANDQLKNGSLFEQLFSGSSMEPGAVPCLMYLLAAAALAGSLVLLFTSKPLLEYLGDRL